MATRRTASSRASLALSSGIRRAWSRSSAATVWRLFFTRWWISRIVASLVSSSCSRRRSSETSRTRSIAPVLTPAFVIGMARIVTVALAVSTSVRHDARPMTTTASDSSTCWAPPAARSATIFASTSPMTSPMCPIRCTADTAFGLA